MDVCVVILSSYFGPLKPGKYEIKHEKIKLFRTSFPIVIITIVVVVSAAAAVSIIIINKIILLHYFTHFKKIKNILQNTNLQCAIG